MAHIVIHKKGAFNVWSTICDACLFDKAMTEAEIGAFEQEDKINTAKKHGTSRGELHKLRSVVSGNAENLSTNKFIKKYLTLEATCNSSK